MTACTLCHTPHDDLDPCPLLPPRKPVEGEFPARFGSYCSCGCRVWIRVGDPILMTSIGAILADCESVD